MSFEVDLFDWKEIWDASGPLWIGVTAIIVFGLAAALFTRVVPIRSIRSLVVPSIIVGFLIVLVATAEVWGS